MLSHQLFAAFLCAFDKHRPIICLWLLGLLSSPFAFSVEATAQATPVRYTVLDRGPSLVRTLINTPGLNNHGDFATWHAVSPSVMQGAVIGRQESTYFHSDGR